MGDGLRTIRVVTTDESLLSNVRAAASTLEGWEVAHAPSVDELMAGTPALGDVILLDGWLRSGNVYENCRRLTGNTRCRTYVVVEHDNRLAEPIARFCGATGVLNRPLVGHAPARGAGADQRPARGAAARAPRRARGDHALPREAADRPRRRARREPGLGADRPRHGALQLRLPRVQARRGVQARAALRRPAGLRDAGLRGPARRAGAARARGHLPRGLARHRRARALRRELVPVPPAEHGPGRRDRHGAPRGRPGAEARPGATSSAIRSRSRSGISNAPAADVKRREDLFSKARKAFLAAREVGGGVVAAG